MTRSIGASTWGNKHAVSDCSKDIELVVRVLLENKVMRKVKGRVGMVVGGEFRRFREAVNSMWVGKEKLKNDKLPEALANLEKIMDLGQEDMVNEAGLEYYDDDVQGGFFDLEGGHVDLVV